MHSAAVDSDNVNARSAHMSKELTLNSDARDTLMYSATADSSDGNARSSE
jgi:hypothetical protein